MHRTLAFFTLALCGGLAILSALWGVPPEAAEPPKAYSPKIAPASPDAAAAARRIRVPAGTRADLFAAEPMLANPVSFCIDSQNRFYVVETHRLHAGVTDIRGHMNWLDDDLACRTVADRVAMYHKYLGDKFSTYEVEHERIRLIEDRAGSGKADHSSVFADGFHGADEGLGAGVLARGGNVWFACIPHLWSLRDTTGAGRADVRRSLQTGYGVHVGFIGHDLHGLRFGPDGKLYFSIGDRGLNVRAGGRSVFCPDTGAVLRCNPDGSELEIVATGLRNSQELAFDQYGNLFTGDNNADHGDKARLVYVVEGGDSGWRIGYQHLRWPVALGPWNAEKLWDPHFDSQAAYIVPPLANLADGPSGLTHDPGTSQLPERYRDHFFLCDFRGGSGGQSGIRSFAVKPHGAAFEMVDAHECIWSVLATDVDFGMDGALYLTDWVEGWGKPGKGRIYKVHDPAKARDPLLLEVRKLMAEGMARRPTDELAKLLEHPDQRVRQEAQFTLAEKGADAVPTFTRLATGSHNLLARLHAIWGLGQIGCKVPAAYGPLPGLLADDATEVRAQAAKVLGEGKVAGAYDKLLPLLRDKEPRVRFFAALSLGKLGRKDAVGPILDLLRDNADKDQYLRHAGVMALTRLADRVALNAAAADASAAVRLGVLLALRRLESPELAHFLNDADPRLVLEAARAIYDVPVPAAFPALAALTRRSGVPEPLMFRALNANFRLGRAENAAAVAAVAARAHVPDMLRVEALQELSDWAQPSGRDRVVGLWRPLGPRPASLAADALRPALGGVFSAPAKVRQEGARVAAKLGIKEVGPALLTLVADPKQPAQVRVETLRALETLKDERLPQAVKLSLADASAALRAAARRVQARLKPGEALASLETALEKGEQVERQSALTALGEMKTPAADAALSRWLDRLLADQVPPEIRLDLLEAAGRRSADGAIKGKLARFEAARKKDDHLAAYREALVGGDAEAGRRLFFGKAEVSCLRCHKVKGEGGEVGPDLSGIGTREKREYILESIVDPNRQIAKGFETVVLETKKGQLLTGILKGEDAKALHLMTAEGARLTVPKDQIEERTRGKSAMPEDIIKNLSKTELRDLVEFLAGLK